METLNSVEFLKLNLDVFVERTIGALVVLWKLRCAYRKEYFCTSYPVDVYMVLCKGSLVYIGNLDVFVERNMCELVVLRKLRCVCRNENWCTGCSLEA